MLNLCAEGVIALSQLAGMFVHLSMPVTKCQAHSWLIEQSPRVPRHLEIWKLHRKCFAATRKKTRRHRGILAAVSPPWLRALAHPAARMLVSPAYPGDLRTLALREASAPGFPRFSPCLAVRNSQPLRASSKTR